ncbi:Nephrin like protein [Argiope bruennichi]|uniref:Nephrin like protein n=1 Tax=Argiope bruennichi TaxID=94029 RepID=A0A8T0FT91_ARGBR|nr:Nephrin like protein [Argiope bruennichi]
MKESIKTHNGKPDPPEEFQAQNVTSDRVLLSWAPAFDGGSPQFFRIRYMVKGSNEINTVDVLPTNASVFMITGLEPGTEYSFALMAWNVYGESGYTENEVVAQTTVPRRLPSTAIDALAKNNEDVPVFLLVIICIAGTLLILINGAIVACYMQRKKKRQTQGYPVSEAKGPPYDSSMYSRDKYHDTINGEALRSPLNDVEETFHEDILMKEIMKQEAEPSKSSKIEPKVPPRTHQNNQRWSSSAENSCPDILKNGHNYVKDGLGNFQTSEKFGHKYPQGPHFKPQSLPTEKTFPADPAMFNHLTLIARGGGTDPCWENQGAGNGGPWGVGLWGTEFGEDKDNCHPPSS